ncbi:hypothetical protein QOZ80_6BG0486540 [Eleusine coracana subsp. coracana]|nr:hypothetical protein QOZ80_6BG0486540 [Eleusine coracana subsp. coracana]
MDPNSRRKPARRRRRRKPDAQPDTTIDSLSDDILADIFVRLPSLATLGRAAVVCPRWRRLASSGDFLRRYRALHPSPPLLGCFISFADSLLPVFHRADDYSDRDLAAAARGSDFLFTSFTAGNRWSLKDCHDGLLLLSNGIVEEKLALFDSVSRRCVKIPLLTLKDDGSSERGVTCFLSSSGGDVDEGRDSFRVLSLERDWVMFTSNRRVVQRIRAHVYSSRTGKWRSHKWVLPLVADDYSNPPPPPPPPPAAMPAAGRIYWKSVCSPCKVLLSLDTGTMKFSYVALPPVPHLSSNNRSDVVGDSENGVCCLVSAPTPEHEALRVWLRNEEKGWRELQSSDVLLFFRRGGNFVTEYQVAAVIAGVVLLQLCERGCNVVEHRYIALRIKNKSLDGRITSAAYNYFEKEAQFFSGDGPGRMTYPYFMT